MSSNRRSTPIIGKRPHGNRSRRSTQQAQQAQQAFRQALNHRYKKDLIARGVIPNPADRPYHYQFSWVYGDMEGVVYADDRSSARGLIKRELGIRRKDRLPIEVRITRSPNEDST